MNTDHQVLILEVVARSRVAIQVKWVWVMVLDKAILAALVATVVGPCVGAGLFFLIAGL